MLSRLGNPTAVVLLPDGQDSLKLVMTYTHGETVYEVKRSSGGWSYAKLTDTHTITLGFPHERAIADHATKLLTAALEAFSRPVSA